MDRREFTASLLAGGCAGMCVDLALFPLDTIKTRLQSQQGFQKAGGFRGIYAGVPSAAAGSFPSAAAFFVTYETSKTLFGDFMAAPMAPVSHMMAASLGEVVACLVRVPTEVVKQRTQASPSTNTYRVLLSTLREEGLRGLYRGYGSTVLREIPFSLVQFPLWEYLKSLWSWREGRPVHSWQAALCGAFAGGEDYALMVLHSSPLSPQAGSSVARGSLPSVLYGVWRSRGVSGLFAGSVPRITFISVGGFIFLGAYEKVRHTLL
uniref:Mitochondrial S-adenosylmethionine carrier protein n=1 Tax=Denticeps clupeoides TaxID=299321 RepID=A0A8C4AGH9_9TELE